MDRTSSSNLHPNFDFKRIRNIRRNAIASTSGLEQALCQKFHICTFRIIDVSFKQLLRSCLFVNDRLVWGTSTSESICFTQSHRHTRGTVWAASQWALKKPMVGEIELRNVEDLLHFDCFEVWVWSLITFLFKIIWRQDTTRAACTRDCAPWAQCPTYASYRWMEIRWLKLQKHRLTQHAACWSFSSFRPPCSIHSVPPQICLEPCCWKASS